MFWNVDRYEIWTNDDIAEAPHWRGVYDGSGKHRDHALKHIQSRRRDKRPRRAGQPQCRRPAASVDDDYGDVHNVASS